MNSHLIDTNSQYSLLVVPSPSASAVAVAEGDVSLLVFPIFHETSIHRLLNKLDPTIDEDHQQQEDINNNKKTTNK